MAEFLLPSWKFDRPTLGTIGLLCHDLPLVFRFCPIFSLILTRDTSSRTFGYSGSRPGVISRVNSKSKRRSSRTRLVEENRIVSVSNGGGNGIAGQHRRQQRQRPCSQQPHLEPSSGVGRVAYPQMTSKVVRCRA